MKNRIFRLSLEPSIVSSDGDNVIWSIRLEIISNGKVKTITEEFQEDAFKSVSNYALEKLFRKASDIINPDFRKQGEMR